jgi:hypothetical protein
MYFDDPYSTTIFKKSDVTCNILSGKKDYNSCTVRITKPHPVTTFKSQSSSKKRDYVMPLNKKHEVSFFIGGDEIQNSNSLVSSLRYDYYIFPILRFAAVNDLEYIQSKDEYGTYPSMNLAVMLPFSKNIALDFSVGADPITFIGTALYSIAMSSFYLVFAALGVDFSDSNGDFTSDLDVDDWEGYFTRISPTIRFSLGEGVIILGYTNIDTGH